MEDRELVAQVLKNGDTKCFAQVVSRYSGMIFSKAIGIVKREKLAKDVTQQTFIKAYDRLDCWLGDSLGPWLTTIAMHTALTVLEKEKRRRAKPIELLKESEIDNNSEYAKGSNPAETSYSDVHEQRLQCMERAISQLPDTDRQLIEMHYFRKMKTDEIARKLNMSQSNVLVKLHRIRERLKIQMQHGE